MTTQPSIPTTINDLTTDWVNTVLAHVGYDATAREVTVGPIGTGQMASSLRVAIDYDGPSGEAPSSVVVKMASADPNSRAAGARGAYEREVRYYQELDDVLAVATPRAYWSDINLATSDFAVVLEDMYPAQQGDQIQGCNADQVMQAAVNIAGLHAPHWSDDSLFELSWLTAPKDERVTAYAETKVLVEMMTPGFIDRYQNRIDERHRALLEWFAENVDTWLADHGNDHFGLTHGDHRLDNLLFNAADTNRPVTVVDWQTISVRNPVADISYLLGTSVEPTVRAEIEADTIAAYHGRLCELGVGGYSLDDCVQDYQQQTPQALLLTVLGSMFTVQTDRGDDMFMAMLHRSSEQMFSHGIFPAASRR